MCRNELLPKGAKTMAEPIVVDPTVVTVAVAYAVGTSAAIGYLYRLMFSNRSMMEKISADQVKELWEVISEIQRDIKADRQTSADERVRLAREMGNLVTKENFERGMDRLIAEVHRAIDNRRPSVTPAQGD